MTSLEGRTAIVTGAARGLGRAHALLLSRLGARVVVNDTGGGLNGDGNSDNAAADVVAEIQNAGGQAVAHFGSVSDWNAAREMIELAVQTFGGLDILVNNAGILRDRMLVNMSEGEWDAVIDVHLKGHFCLLHHAAVHWRSESKAGRTVDASVLNTSSGSGLRGNPGQINYASAKSGIAMMTLVAARELSRYGVRVNAIAPVARTRLTENTPGLGERIGQQEGFDKWDPENVSPLVAWLVSPECKLSGEVFGIVGGRIARQKCWTEQEVFEVDRRWSVDELKSALDHLPAGPSEFEFSA
ncbi:SDR family oxidoreductase [Mycolicibacterium holsaticum]|uniref:Short-chain dehydrogenase n=1 Tax=Mycolicibacterium holsaticum TaxID=152142 RepID=A0A1E3S452_9MYCO|nr:SDR family oxidoreductase [Mycolicibacterium holsaticum]ODQ96377.1 short-chain dehydrogenase [Mycolicibacterium holsaticum]